MIVVKRLTDHAGKSKLIPLYQSGFSTDTELANIVTRITVTMDHDSYDYVVDPLGLEQSFWHN